MRAARKVIVVIDGWVLEYVASGTMVFTRPSTSVAYVLQETVMYDTTICN